MDKGTEEVRVSLEDSLTSWAKAPGHWEITLLNVNMHGKALFFKTISVQQNEIRTDFQPMPDNVTLAQGAEELHRQCTGQTAARIGNR
jgi:hypothetical protein